MGKARLRLIDFYGSVLENIDEADTAEAFSSIWKSLDLAAILSETYSVCWEHIFSEVEALPESITFPQSPQRFQWLKEDDLGVRLLKIPKMLTHKLLSVILGKKAKPWTQTVHLRSLCIWELAEIRYQTLIWLASDLQTLKPLCELIQKKELGLPITTAEISKDLLERRKRIKEDTTEFNTNFTARVKFRVERTGTLEFSDRMFHHIPEYEHLKTMNYANAVVKPWAQFVVSLQDELELRSKIKVLDDSSTKLTEDLCLWLNTEWKKGVDSLIEEDIKKLESALKKTEKSENFESLITFVAAFEDEVYSDLLKEHWTNGFSAELQTRRDQFNEDLDTLFESLPETSAIIDRIDWQKNRPSPGKENLQIQKLVRGYFTSKIAPVHELAFRSLLDGLSDLNFQFEQIQQILKVSEELQADEEQAFETLSQSLNRLLNRLKTLSENASQLIVATEAKLRNIQRDTALSLTNMLLEHRLGQLHWQQTQQQIRKQASSWQSWGSVYAAKLMDALRLAFRFLRLKSGEAWSVIREFLGYAPPGTSEVSETLEVSALVKGLERNWERLPFIYQQLFSLDKETQDRFYKAPVAVVSQFNESYQLWNDGVGANFLLLGDTMTGKSAFFNHARRNIVKGQQLFEWNPSRRICTEQALVHNLAQMLGQTRIKDLGALVTYLSEKKVSTVIFLEGVERLFERTSDGFGALDALGHLLTETAHKVFWVLAIHTPAYNYLQHAIGFGGFFSHIAQAENKNKQDLRNQLLSRHNLTGYNLIFTPNEKIKSYRSYKKLQNEPEKQQEYLEDLFFDQLSDYVGGNTGLAILCWVMCIDEISESDISLTMIPEILNSNPTEFSLESQFILSALIQHGSLDEMQVSRVLNWDQRKARLELHRLSTLGWLTRNKGEFYVEKLTSRLVSRYLRERNLL